MTSLKDLLALLLRQCNSIWTWQPTEGAKGVTYPQQSSFKPVELPFRADHRPNLPSAEEIRHCPHDLQKRRRGTRVVAVNEQIVAKYGSALDVAERQALVYLERHVKRLVAPRLFAMYYDNKQLFLVMERVQRTNLETLWHSLSESEKDRVIFKLRETVDAMRQSPCPWPSFIGGLDGGGV